MSFIQLFVTLLPIAAFACGGDHHHHGNYTYYHEDPEIQRRLIEHRQLEQEVDMPFECNSPVPTPEETIEAGLVHQKFHEQIANLPEGVALARANYQIAVTFHIIRDSNGNGEMTNSMVDQYLAYLNDEFAGTGLSYVRRAIRRHTNNAWYNCDHTQHEAMGSTIREGGKADMNVYFCNIVNPRIGGWAYYPFGDTAGSRYDGIVIQSNLQRAGFPEGYVRRTVLPHEAGVSRKLLVFISF